MSSIFTALPTHLQQLCSNTGEKLKGGKCPFNAYSDGGETVNNFKLHCIVIVIVAFNVASRGTWVRFVTLLVKALGFHSSCQKTTLMDSFNCRESRKIKTYNES